MSNSIQLPILHQLVEFFVPGIERHHSFQLKVDPVIYSQNRYRNPMLIPILKPQNFSDFQKKGFSSISQKNAQKSVVQSQTTVNVCNLNPECYFQSIINTHPMKKIVSLMFVSILLAACTPATGEPETSESNNQNTPPVSTTTPEDKSMESKVTNAQGENDKCAQMEALADKNNCYVTNAYYASLDTPNIANETCEKVYLDNVESSKCYWIFAMRMKDEALCDKIYFTYPGDYKEDYLTRDVCKKYISTSTSNAQWRLQGGIPKLGDEGVAYGGRAEMTGWMEEVSLYENMVQRFHVSESSLMNLPLAPFGKYGFNNDFDIDTKNDPDTAKRIREHSSEKNPITIIVDQIIYPSEMSPQMHVVLK